jgi:hypothetical protein
MMDFVIVVNDAGELKSISATELKAACRDRFNPSNLFDVLNEILDARSAAAEAHDAARDTPKD